MNLKKYIILIILTIFLFSIASVSASDTNETLMTSIDDSSTELSKTDEKVIDQKNMNDKTGAGEGTYEELSNEIGTGGDKNLTKSYYKYTGGNTIEIRTPGVINGNGAVIDMNGSNIRAFYVTASGVTIKNLTISNTNINGDGAAIYFNQGGSVTNCNFINNRATVSYGGGAIYFEGQGSVTNCNFINNRATGAYGGGAIYFKGQGDVTNCNFNNNQATGAYGGAIYIRGTGNVINCNFTNNQLNGGVGGGAVYFLNTGTVTNCNFNNNTAKGGGAVEFQNTGRVANCNFNNNRATGAYDGGAIYFIGQGDVTNCNFNNNQANSDYGGAIYINTGNVTNCNFINNRATDGGAIYFQNTGSVITCNFNNNAANDGGAIFSLEWATTADTCIFKTSSDTKTNVVTRSPTLNVDNFTSFYGSGEKLIFNLTTNSGIPITNGNISISVYFKGNNSGVCNYACLSGEGWIPDLPVGSYYAIFNTEYAGFQKINRTITVMPNNTFAFLNYTINGNNNSVIELSNDFYYDAAYDAVYDAAFVNGIVINRSVTIKGNGNTIDAKKHARIFNIQSNNVILKNITFANGQTQGATLDGQGGAIFWQGSEGEVSHCTFINNTANTAIVSDGGAIRWYGSNGNIHDCIFINNKANDGGGAISFRSYGSVTNCNFNANSATVGGAIAMVSGSVTNCNFNANSATVGGAIYMDSGSVTNCNFNANSATVGGAIYMDSGSVTNCNFTANGVTGGGGAIYCYEQDCSVTNCNFNANTALEGGAIYCYEQDCSVTNCNFTANNASFGGAVWMFSGSVINSSFVNNTSIAGGGAIRFASSDSSVKYCNFTDNSAKYGGAVNFDNSGSVENCYFVNNSVNVDGRGGAVYFRGGNANVAYCNFTNNNAFDNGGAIYFANDGDVLKCNFTANTANNCGGAVFVNGASGKITDSLFTLNEAIFGGALYLNNQDLILSVSDFIANNAVQGGAVYIMGGNNVISNSTFDYNNATYSLRVDVSKNKNKTKGGAIYIGGENNVIYNSKFYGNAAGVANDTAVIVQTTPGLLGAYLDVTGVGDDGLGGAIFIGANGNNITSNEFNDNIARNGSAVYNDASGTYFKGGLFIKNQAWSYVLEVNGTNKTHCKDNIINKIYYGANVEIKLYNYIAGDNILNGIYNARNVGDVTFNTVGYIIDNDIAIVKRTIDGNTNPELGAKEGILYQDSLERYQTMVITVRCNETGEIVANKTVRTDLYGNYSFNLVGLNSGIYTIVAYHPEDANYRHIITSNIFEIVKLDSTLDVGDMVFDYNSTGYVNVSLENAIGIEANVIGHPQAIITINGTIISVSNLSAGNYILNVTTIVDGNHNSVTKTANITVNKIKTVLSANAVATVYNVNKYLVITLKDVYGNPLKDVGISVDLNGAKKYTTDANGQVKVSTKGLAPKTYTAKVTFNGDTNYEKSAKNVKVTVKKAASKIAAAKKTFKAKTKVKKYAAVLKDSTGKVIKNAKLTLKVKGNVYSAKTNSKGKAVFKITKLNKKGTYKVVIKFNGDKYYAKSGKNTKITVKADKSKTTFKTVSEGSKDAKTVKKIQQALKDHGYYLTYDGHYLMIDGKYNSCTVRSVKEFQRDHGLKVNGKVDAKTAKKLGII